MFFLESFISKVFYSFFSNSKSHFIEEPDPIS